MVCEASSFQLEDTDFFAPSARVFINLSPDHLDRHGTLEDYLAAKLRIFANQGNDDFAVYNGQTPELRDRDLGGCARRIRFCPAEASSADPDCELSMRDGVIFAADEPLLRADELQLLGAHNVENAMAAAAAALASGLPRDAVAEGLRSFEGGAPPSRAGERGERSALRQRLEGDKRRVGPGRHQGLRRRRPPDRRRATEGGELRAPRPAVKERCVACYLIGEAAEGMASALAPAAEQGVQITEEGTLERAVEAAAADAKTGEVVLLSPACASFDAFKDFEARGDRFRELVEALG